MDAYSEYNQIPMFVPYRRETTFMTKQANYQHNVIPIGLENADTIYKMMMDKAFREGMGKLLEIYWNLYHFKDKNDH